MAGRKRTQKPSVPWPADSVSPWPLEKLLPYAQNARQHSPAQVDQIAKAILEWGWTIPVLVEPDGTLIAGHGRVLAAHQLKIKTVPTMVAKGWTPAQVQAYRIADNKLALNAEWDNALLITELAQLQAGEADLLVLGFNEAEVASLLAPDSDPYAEWQRTGMPSHVQGEDKPFFSIMVHFRAVDDVKEFARLVGQQVNPDVRRTHYMWFPALPDQALTVEDAQSNAG